MNVVTLFVEDKLLTTFVKHKHELNNKKQNYDKRRSNKST